MRRGNLPGFPFDNSRNGSRLAVVPFATTMQRVTPESLLAERDFVRALARSLVRDSARADDVAQHALMVASRERSRVSDLRAWLVRIVRNLVRDGARKDRRRERHEGAAARTDVMPSTHDVLAREEVRRRVVDAVLGLPQPYRGVVLMRYWDGRSAADIAAELGVPDATVRAQLKRGRDLLRERLQRDGGKDWMAAIAPLAGLPTTSAAAAGAAAGLGAMLMTTQLKITFAVAAVVVASLVLWAVQPPASVPGAPERPEAGVSTATGELADVGDAGEQAAPVVSEREAADVQAAPAATRLLAHVVGPNGRAVAGAVIDVPRREAFGEAVSDADGNLVLVVDREQIRIWRGTEQSEQLRVRAEGHATRFLLASIKRDGDTNLGELELGLGGVVVGRVVDGQGKPLAGVAVEAGQAALGRAAADAAIAGPLPSDARITARTAADGSYRLRGVAAGPARVWANVEQRGWAYTEPFDLLAGRETHVPEIVLGAADASQCIAGVVTGPDGQPVPNAIVVVAAFVDGPLRARRVEADGQGRFTSVAVNADTHYVTAYHPKSELYPAHHASVLPGVEDLALQLTEIRWLEVVLVDKRTGAEVGEPWVRIEHGGDLNHGEKVPELKSEKLGGGRVRAPLPPGSFRIGASAKLYVHEQRGPFTADALGERLEIQLQRKAIVSGTVVGEGRPIAGARVQTVKVLPDDIAIETDGFRTRLFDGGAFAAKSDAEGRFEQPASTAVRGAPDVLLVSKKGWATAEVPFDPGEHGLVEELQVQLTRGGSIEGNVWLPAGRTSAGALVVASNGNGITLDTRADENGVYRLDHLTPGPWQVRYREQGRQWISGISSDPPKGPYRGDCTVTEGAVTTYNVDARDDEVAVHGRLTIDGQPASRWAARLGRERFYSVEESAESKVFDAYGGFALQARPEPHLLILEKVADAGPFTSLRKQVDFAAERGPFELAFATGEVVGEAPAGTELRAHVALAGDWHFHVGVTVAADGRYSLRVPAGSVELSMAAVSVGGKKGWVPIDTVELAAGGKQTVEWK